MVNTRSAPAIAIATGDPSGIGPEIALKAIAAEWRAYRDLRFFLVGPEAILRSWNTRLALELALDAPADSPRGVWILDPMSCPVPEGISPGSPETARVSLECLQSAANGCLRGEFHALVTAPVNKEAILRAGTRFVGQTEFLAECTGSPEVTMMLLGEDAQGRSLRVSLVTTHIPIREVPASITSSGVDRAIRQSADACRRLGLDRARIAVCGLNPHAGEGGMLGSEDREIILPAVVDARARGLEVQGPLSADTVFHSALRGAFDVVVAMYHDQGLPALKLVAFESGVNWTLGLPFPRTSPDHGTAYDIAGKGTADPSSMRAAVRLAIRLAGLKPRPRP